jgi:3-hydroxyacyl-[acyl-carrier-protein] dehydratase
VIGGAEIKAILPHRHPILLLDQVTELVPGERLVANLTVGRDQQWYRDLPAGDERADDYPDVLLIESWCQAAAVLGARSAPPGKAAGERVPLLGSLTGVRLRERVRPGDVVEHRVRLVRDFGDAQLLDGESSVGGRPVLEVGRITVTSSPRGERKPGPGRSPGSTPSL